MNRIIIILAFFLLFSCGFEPIHSKKNPTNNYNFTIASIGFSGENKINQNLKNNLKNYIGDETKPIKYDLIINSNIKKTITSKNKKGNPEIFNTKVIINIDILENDELIIKTIFEESFEYKNKASKFELKQYEANIQNNLASKISSAIIKYLYSVK